MSDGARGWVTEASSVAEPHLWLFALAALVVLAAVAAIAVSYLCHGRAAGRGRKSRITRREAGLELLWIILPIIILLALAYPAVRSMLGSPETERGGERREERRRVAGVATSAGVATDARDARDAPAEPRTEVTGPRSLQ